MALHSLDFRAMQLISNYLEASKPNYDQNLGMYEYLHPMILYGRGIHRPPVLFSPPKVPVMRKVFPCHESRFFLSWGLVQYKDAILPV